MGQTLRRSSINKILLFTAFLIGIAFQGGYSQTMLSPGDLVIITVNADENEDGNKTFDFIPLIDLENGTEIKFTDAPYIDSDGAIDDSEGTVTYTAPNGIDAGEIITYEGKDNGGFSSSGNFNPSTVGDNIIVYQGERDSPNYLYGIGWARGPSVWEYDPDTSPNNRSDEPPGLSRDDDTILSLGTTHNYQYSAGNGIKGTKSTLLSLLGEESNWDKDNDNAFSTFSPDFNVIDPPTVAFTGITKDISEGEGAVDINVELVEADETAVDVEVTFLNSSSTATNNEDFYSFSTETVSFGSNASEGDTKTVSLDIQDDSDFEGSEKAVFQLQSNTTGTVIEPRTLTITIKDNDSPDIVINEFLADPDDDVDGNGNTGASDDEFVEFVNLGSEDIDISGWQFSDDGSDRVNTFSEGTVIPAGRALILFNDDTDNGTPEGYFGGAIVQVSDNSLSLNNGGDTPTLFDANGNIIDQINYSSSSSGISLNRDPNSSDAEFVDHTDLSSENFSPGTKADGTAFGSKFAIGIRGTEGWRMISSPVQNATFDEFFNDFWMQGITGSDDPDGGVTLMTWDEKGGSFTAVDNMDEEFIPGKGYIAYVFEDDEPSKPGIQGGFPKVITTEKTENGKDKANPSISISTTDLNDNGKIDNNDESIEGWNLLGNPFGTDISVAALIDALEDANENVQANIQVWDHSAGNGQGSFVTLDAGDQLAPFQAFFVKYTADNVDATVTFNRDELAANMGANFYKDINESNKFIFDLELHGEEFYDTYSLEFSENATADLDRYDAYKLFSMNQNSVNVFSNLNSNRLQKNALPADLQASVEIPLGFEANGRSSLTFRWDSEMKDIPSEWDLILIDEETDREIDLRRDDEYSFKISNEEGQQNTSASNENALLNKSNNSQDSRFTLAIQPNTQSTASNNLPESVKLKPNYPNPFNPTTTIPYELTEDSDVLLTVWNMIGQKVATLVDGTVEAGTHEVSWNASNMPSGMYIARFEVNGTVFTRKMTLIK